MRPCKGPEPRAAMSKAAAGQQLGQAAGMPGWKHKVVGRSSPPRLHAARPCARLASRELGCVLDEHVVTPVSVDAAGSQWTCDADARPRAPRGCAAAACACVLGLGRARGALDCGEARLGGETLCGRTPHALQGAHLPISRHTMRPLRAMEESRPARRSLRSATGAPRAVVLSISDEQPKSSACLTTSS